MPGERRKHLPIDRQSNAGPLARYATDMIDDDLILARQLCSTRLGLRPKAHALPSQNRHPVWRKG